MEADRRHAELVVEQLGLQEDKGIGTPDLSGADEDDNDDDIPLTGADITSYRGVKPGATISVLTALIARLRSRKGAGR